MSKYKQKRKELFMSTKQRSGRNRMNAGNVIELQKEKGKDAAPDIKKTAKKA